MDPGPALISKKYTENTKKIIQICSVDGQKLGTGRHACANSRSGRRRLSSPPPARDGLGLLVVSDFIQLPHSPSASYFFDGLNVFPPSPISCPRSSSLDFLFRCVLRFASFSPVPPSFLWLHYPTLPRILPISPRNYFRCHPPSPPDDVSNSLVMFHCLISPV